MTSHNKIVHLDEYRSTPEMFKKSTYFKVDNEDIGVRLDDGFTKISLSPCAQPNRMRLQLSNSIGHYFTAAFDRAELAEFVQIASIYLDADDKYRPTGDLISLDYED